MPKRNMAFIRPSRVSVSDHPGTLSHCCPIDVEVVACTLSPRDAHLYMFLFSSVSVLLDLWNCRSQISVSLMLLKLTMNMCGSFVGRIQALWPWIASKGFSFSLNILINGIFLPMNRNAVHYRRVQFSNLWSSCQATSRDTMMSPVLTKKCKWNHSGN